MDQRSCCRYTIDRATINNKCAVAIVKHIKYTAYVKQITRKAVCTLYHGCIVFSNDQNTFICRNRYGCCNLNCSTDNDRRKIVFINIINVNVRSGRNSCC